MTLRTLASALMLVAASLVLAPPAQADQQVLQGVYHYQLDGGASGTLEIYPSCVPTVGDLREPLYLPVACHLFVGPSPGGMAGGDARMSNGVWAYTAQLSEGMTCPDGSKVPTTERVTMNTDTWTGTRTVLHNAQCGLQPGMVRTNFIFGFEKPLAIPVEQYPLICEPGGLRRCF